jgi:hypothetical protein
MKVCAGGATGFFTVGMEGSRKFAAVIDRRYMERNLIMNELDSLEQEMRGWQPRKPAARLARRLFGRANHAPAALRRAEFWSWLSPLAACVLTVLVAVGSANYRGGSLEGKDGPDLFAGLSLDPGASNAPLMARLSQMDENVQWNVCPELASPAGTSFGESSAAVGDRRAAATNLNRN